MLSEFSVLMLDISHFKPFKSTIKPFNFLDFRKLAASVGVENAPSKTR